MPSLARHWCEQCGAETLHAHNRCVHCKRERQAQAHPDRKRRKRGERAKMAEEELGFQLRAHRVPEGVTQFQFAKHLGRKFAADRAWPSYGVILEVQGGVWRKGGGAHSHPLNILRDIEKQRYAALLCYLVVPVTTDEVRKGEAIQWIVRVLESRGWKREGGS